MAPFPLKRGVDMKEFVFELAPTVKIICGEKEYILAIDNAAIKKWEEATGKELLGKGEVPETGTDILTLFWVASLLYQPDTTQEEIDHILHPGNYEQVADVLNELLESVMPEPTEDGEVKN